MRAGDARGREAEAPCAEAAGSCESWWLGEDGSRRLLRWTSVPLPDAPGATGLVACVGVNVTGTHELDRELRESEERFRALADGAPVPIWICDEGGLVTFFNRRWLELTGRAAEEELGRGWEDDIHPEDLPWAAPALEDAADTHPRPARPRRRARVAPICFGMTRPRVRRHAAAHDRARMGRRRASRRSSSIPTLIGQPYPAVTRERLERGEAVALHARNAPEPYQIGARPAGNQESPARSQSSPASTGGGSSASTSAARSARGRRPRSKRCARPRLCVGAAIERQRSDERLRESEERFRHSSGSRLRRCVRPSSRTRCSPTRARAASASRRSISRCSSGRWQACSAARSRRRRSSRTTSRATSRPSRATPRSFARS